VDALSRDLAYSVGRLNKTAPEHPLTSYRSVRNQRLAVKVFESTVSEFFDVHLVDPG
jgi:hypothetical protein